MIKEIFLPAVFISLTTIAWLISNSYKNENITDIIKAIGRKTPVGVQKGYASYADLLGLDYSPEYLAGLRYGLTFGGLLLAALFGIGKSFSWCSFFLLISFVSWVTPSLWLKFKEKKRDNEIDRDFPIMIDLLQIFGEASDLYMALRMLPNTMSGEMQRQLLILKSDLATYPLKHALYSFADRLRHPQASNFVSVVLFGIETGANVNDILSTFASRTQKNRVNERKRQNKIQPILMSVIPAIMMFIIVMLIMIPTVDKIADGLNKIG